MLRPRAGLANCVSSPRCMSYAALLLEDGVALVAAPQPEDLCKPPKVVAMVHLLVPPEASACSADGALLGIACRTELRFYVLTTQNATGAPIIARLRGKTRLNSLPKGLDVATLDAGMGSASAHGVAAVAASSGLILVSTIMDNGLEARVTHHSGTPIGVCRFSDDGRMLALATMDGRLLVRRASAASEWATGGSELAWCARCPCERVLALDLSACGRWIALTGWRGDLAVFDGAAFGAPPPSNGELCAAAGIDVKSTSTSGAAVGGRTGCAGGAGLVTQTTSSSHQDWRLAYVEPAADPTASPGPALAVCSRAPHRAGVLYTNGVPHTAGLAAADSSSRAPARELAMLYLDGEGPRRAPAVTMSEPVALMPQVPAGSGKPIRGLCIARVRSSSSSGGGGGGGGGGSGSGGGSSGSARTTDALPATAYFTSDAHSGTVSRPQQHGHADESWRSLWEDVEAALWLDADGEIGWCRLWPWQHAREIDHRAADGEDVDVAVGTRGGAGCGDISSIVLATLPAGVVRLCTQPSADEGGPSHTISITRHAPSQEAASEMSSASSTAPPPPTVVLRLPEISADLVHAALTSWSSTVATRASCGHGGSTGSTRGAAELSTSAYGSFSLLLSATHIGFVGPDTVQFAKAREGAAWTTLLAECVSACLVGDHTLLLLRRRRREGVDPADALDGDMDGAGVNEQSERPPTSTLVAVALDGDGLRAEHMTTHLSALGACAWRVLPATCNGLRATDISDAPLRGTASRDQFVLLTSTAGGGGGYEAWLGETAAGTTPALISQRPLRVVCSPGVGATGAGAHSFRLLTARGDELQPVVELVASP